MTNLTFNEVFLEQLGIDLGIMLVLVSDGRIMFERTITFVPTYDYSKDGVTASFDADSFGLKEPDGDFQPFNYGVAYQYKEIPTLKKWLVQQNMQFNVIKEHTNEY
jgi:hypothetical protein